MAMLSRVKQSMEVGVRRSEGEGGHTLDSGLNPSDNSLKPNSVLHSPDHQFISLLFVSKNAERKMKKTYLLIFPI